jgi:hypothetical protein
MRKALTKYDELYNLACAGITTVRLYTSPISIPGALGRTNYHSGGTDLLNPPKHPDYWTFKEDFIREYRLHSFCGRSIRAGIKTVRAGYTLAETEEDYKKGLEEGKLMAHPWVRSYDAGWYINYEGFVSTAKMKQIAHKSVECLGLAFGAVDIGERADGTLVVIEVNRAPGIEGNSVTAYQKAITKWIEEPVEKEKDPIVPITIAEDQL